MLERDGREISLDVFAPLRHRPIPPASPLDGNLHDLQNMPLLHPTMICVSPENPQQLYGINTHFMRLAASCVVSGSGWFSVSGRRKTSMTAIDTRTVNMTLGSGGQTSIWKFKINQFICLMKKYGGITGLC